ncbi:MAG: NYN domain-containing protein [Dehalococcoidales bacterium]|nr:NYN domain-containing protein [Dehalococcoidales bacterium]
MTPDNTTGERQIAVLIDYENAGLGSLRWLFDQISDVGRVIVRKAYADWSASSDKRDELLELGIEPVHLFRSRTGTKNSSDIQLVIDALDLLHQSPVDTFVLVSSDSDFTPLVRKLRSSGKMVIGAGFEAQVARSLVISCDRYYFLNQREKKPEDKGQPLGVETKTGIAELLSRAVKVAMDEQGKVSGSKLNETMQRLDPSFDYRNLGYPTFIKFIESHPWLKITRPRKVGDITVEFVATGEPAAGIAAEKDSWDIDINRSWSARVNKSGDSIPGPTAANDAAKTLNANKLKNSRYKTLQKLLDSSDLLRSVWSRNGNTIVKK